MTNQTNSKILLAESYGIMLEQKFKPYSDSCRNIERIMRLPGGVNWPDVGKLEKGRHAAMAQVITFNSDTAHPLSAFPTPATIIEPTRHTDKVVIEPSEPLKDIYDLDQWGVDERSKQIVAIGRVEGEVRAGDNSDSGWMFEGVCRLKRAGVPDNVIFSLLLDKRFGISKHVLKQSHGLEKYAQRQLQRATDMISRNLGDDSLEWKVAVLNEEFMVIANEGGKCRVASFENVRLERNQVRRVMVVQSFDDFRNRFMHQRVVIGEGKQRQPITVPLGKAWLEHPNRRQYRRVDFLPGMTAPDDIYNLWEGLAYQQLKGSWCKMRRHIYVVLSQRNMEVFWYILRWAAWAVQNPAEPAEVALVFRGGKGTGKGTFCRWLKKLFGQHGLQVYSPAHLTGRFNSHLRAIVLLFADEAIAPGDKVSENMLKGLLTEPTLTIEGKGKDIIQAPNHLHVVMASNSAWVVPASGDERRFAVFDVSDEFAQNKGWFGALNKEMENGGAEAMLDFLMNFKLGNWHPRDQIPATEALNDQRILSLESDEQTWLMWLSEGCAPGDYVDGRVRIPTKEFAAAAKTSDTNAGRFLGKMGCTHDRNARPTCWVTPPLTEARTIWDKVKFKVKWPNDDGVWAAPHQSAFYENVPF